MSGRNLFVVVAAIVALALFGAYLYDGYAPVDDVRQVPVDGDIIEYTFTEYGDEVRFDQVHSYEVLNYNNDGTLAVAMKAGDMIFPMGMSVESYISKVVPDLPADKVEKIGEEQVRTEFGKRNCDVYEYHGELSTFTLWVGQGSGVMYLAHESIDLGPEGHFMEIRLTQCTILE